MHETVTAGRKPRHLRAKLEAYKHTFYSTSKQRPNACFPNGFFMAPRWTYILLVSLLAVHIYFILHSLTLFLAPLWLFTRTSTKLERLRRQLLEL